MDLAQLPLLLTALGGGAIIPALVKGITVTVTGRGRKRRDEVDSAWKRGDREAQKRRVIEEHASHLRRMLYAAPCVDVADIPPYPSYRSTDTPSTSKESPHD